MKMLPLLSNRDAFRTAEPTPKIYDQSLHRKRTDTTSNQHCRDGETCRKLHENYTLNCDLSSGKTQGSQMKLQLDPLA